MKDKIKISKLLALGLRHKPEALGIKVDAEGWALTAAVLKGLAEAGRPTSLSLLKEIVAEDSKGRYSFSSDHQCSRIRANQGHSVKVDLKLQPVEPPEVLYHGTTARTLGMIFAEGLKPMSRHHVHMSADVDTAMIVAARWGRADTVILKIAASEMHRDGYTFYVSHNGVWLSDGIIPQYLELYDGKA